MSGYETRQMRLVALVGHSASGKTTLGEALLYAAGLTTRLETGTLDFNPEERKRGTTISTSVADIPWGDVLIQLLDTPGYIDFQADVLGALAVADNIVMVSDVGAGASGLERFWERSRPGAARIFFLSKCKSPDTDPLSALRELQETFGVSCQALVFPIGKGADFSGVINLLGDPSNIPDEAKETRSSLIESIVEADDALMEKYLSDQEITPEELSGAMRKALSSGSLTPVFFGEAKEGIGVRELADFISRFGLSLSEMPPIKAGEDEIRPEPAGDPAALVFKTITEAHLGEIYYTRVFSGTLKPGMELYNSSSGESEKINAIYGIVGAERKEVSQALPGQVIALVKLKSTATGHTLSSKAKPLKLPWITLPKALHAVAIKPKARGDEEKLSEALSRLNAEDPSFIYRYDPELRQHLLYGYGDIHIDVILAKMAEKFKVQVEKERPKVPYREAIRTKAEAMGRYVKQTGGHGQYGICYIRIEPLPRGGDYEFVNEIFGGAIPKEFIPAVESGIKKAMASGTLAGYPVVDVKVTLYDGKYHEVDSSNMAFEIAGSLAFKEAEANANPYLLEPIMNLTAWVPDDSMGDVISEINARRGRIQGMEPHGRWQVIKALVPMAELLDFTAAIRAKTRGRGWFDMEFSHYDEVPPEIARRVIQAAQAEREEKK
ncbi:MAG: elongation factor G [candidate division WOR-3 bacterium]